MKVTELLTKTKVFLTIPTRQALSLMNNGLAVLARHGRKKSVQKTLDSHEITANISPMKTKIQVILPPAMSSKSPQLVVMKGGDTKLLRISKSVANSLIQAGVSSEG